MKLSTVAVLRPGDWVLYDGSEHQVLRWPERRCGCELSMAPTQWCWPVTSWPGPAPPWSTAKAAPEVQPFALLDSLPGAVLDTAREWERHVVEIETGLPPGTEPGMYLKLVERRRPAGGVAATNLQSSEVVPISRARAAVAAVSSAAATTGLNPTFQSVGNTYCSAPATHADLLHT